MSGGRFEVRMKELDVNFFPVDMSRQLTFKPIRQIKNIILQNKIDIVHSQGARADFFARLSGKIADSPHIICTVAMPVEGFNVIALKKILYRFLDQISGRYVERFIVVSDSLKTLLTEGRGVPLERVVRIYNGIEADQYHPHMKETDLRNQWSIPSEAPLIGAIGRMVWQKGFEYLIKAAPEVLQVSPEAKFLLVGEGPLRTHLEQLVQELNLQDKVIFPGFRANIKNFLSIIDIMVVPSLLEGFPMITLEAMAMTKPIVASRIPGIVEQISHGTEGILVPPRNPKALVTAVLTLLQNKGLASKLSIAARGRVQNDFSVDRMIRDTANLYISLLERNNSF